MLSGQGAPFSSKSFSAAGDKKIEQHNYIASFLNIKPTNLLAKFASLFAIASYVAIATATYQRHDR